MLAMSALDMKDRVCPRGNRSCPVWTDLKNSSVALLSDKTSISSSDGNGFSIIDYNIFKRQGLLGRMKLKKKLNLDHIF